MTQSRSKGKHPEGQESDVQVAMDILKADLESWATVGSDKAMCRSMARAIRSDGHVIQAAVQEVQAARDREFARNLDSPGAVQASDPGAQDAAHQAFLLETSLDEELAIKLQILYMSNSDDEDGYHLPGTAPESSSSAASRLHPADTGQPDKKRECTACGDRHHFFDLARCPCDHEYCRACFAELFQNALKDESLFPPRCCRQPIPLEENRAVLPAPLVGQFLAKKMELETPNRIYCYDPQCSTFVPPGLVADELARCPSCDKRTCAICRGETHEGDCPADESLQQLLSMAGESGWQRCHSCRRLVELNHGCNHISLSRPSGSPLPPRSSPSSKTFKGSFFLRGTCLLTTEPFAACLCGAQFCYSCGVTWKKCACAQWEEPRLLARAEAIVNRDVGGRRMTAETRGRRLEEERANLVRNHECTHLSWRCRQGRHRCEQCSDYLDVYIYECVQCRIMACKRCRFNRL